MNKVRKADQDNRRVHSLQDVDIILSYGFVII
jgi:hypothetical protein